MDIRGLAVEMNRENGLCAWSDFVFYFLGIQRKIIRFDIHKNRVSSALGNSFRRGNPRTGGGDHFIPGSDPQTTKGNIKGICSVGDTDTVFYSQLPGEHFFEFFDIFAPDESGIMYD